MKSHEYVLSPGHHATPDRGRCAMEWVAHLAGEGHTDRPRAASVVAAAYARHYNDVLGDEPRQRLRPYLARMIGTSGDALEERRAWACAEWLAIGSLPAALAAAGLDAHAARLRPAPAAELAEHVTAARAAAAVARADARTRACRPGAPVEWSLRRERARAAVRAAGRDAGLDAARAALGAAAPDAARAALAEAAWAGAWDALWAAAWDERALPSGEALRRGAFALLGRMLPSARLEVPAPAVALHA